MAKISLPTFILSYGSTRALQFGGIRSPPFQTYSPSLVLFAPKKDIIVWWSKCQLQDINQGVSSFLQLHLQYHQRLGIVRRGMMRLRIGAEILAQRRSYHSQHGFGNIWLRGTVKSISKDSLRSSVTSYRGEGLEVAVAIAVAHHLCE